MKKLLLVASAMCSLVGITDVARAINIDINVGTPAPVYVAPPPVYVPPPGRAVVVPGWYGERYYDGHRYWSRHEWDEHQHYDRDHRQHDDDRYHCPPGHAKKGEC